MRHCVGCFAVAADQLKRKRSPASNEFSCSKIHEALALCMPVLLSPTPWHGGPLTSSHSRSPLGAPPATAPSLVAPFLSQLNSPIEAQANHLKPPSSLYSTLKMLNLYPPSAHDVYKKIKLRFTPACDAACEEINKACEGIGTDEKTLVKVLGPRSPNDRALIAYRYKELYDQSLRDLVKSETSGDFGYLLQLTCMTLPQAEAYIVFHAMKGVGTSEQLMYPILLGRTNDEIALLKKAFFDMYETDLSVMVNDDLSGEFHQIITTALQEPQVEYKSSFHTKAKIEEDAEKIYKAGEGKWGTDEGAFIKTLLASPPKHIQHIEEYYTEKYKHGLVHAIESEFSGSSATALSFYVRLSLDPWNTLAELIDNAMAGIGTDESALSAAIVRYHPYLQKIKHAYENKHKISLRERVHGETDGQYQELLMYIMDAPVSIGEYA